LDKREQMAASMGARRDNLGASLDRTDGAETQAAWRGTQAREVLSEAQTSRAAAGKVAAVPGMTDLLAGLGDFMDGTGAEDVDYQVFQLETSERKLGLKTAGEPPNERVFVADVTPGGWAEDRGVEIGDELLAVAQESLTTMSTEKFFKLLKVRPAHLQFQRAVPKGSLEAEDPELEASVRKARQPRQEKQTKQQRLEQQVQKEREEEVRRHEEAEQANAVEDNWKEFTAKETIKNMGWVPAGRAPGRMIVETIVEGSWAETIGIMRGDELVSLNDKEVAQMDDAEFRKRMKKRPLQMVFYRHGEHVHDLPGDLAEEAHIPAGEPPTGLSGAVESFTINAEEGVELLGFMPGELPPNEVAVSEVEPDGWAAQNGVEVDDVLIRVNGVSTEALNEEELIALMQDRPLELTFVKPSKKARAGVPSRSTPGAAGHAAASPATPGAAHAVTSPATPGAAHAVTSPATPGAGQAAKATPGTPAATPGAAKLGEMASQPAAHVDQGKHYKAVAAESDELLGFRPSSMPPGSVFVHMVEPGLWAANQGIAIGDIILSVNGQKIEDLNTSKFQKHLQGRPLTLELERGAGESTAPRKGVRFDCEAPEGIEALGFIPAAYPPEPVIIETVTPDTWSAIVGILEGVDELVAVNGREVSTLTKKEMTKAMKSRPVTLTFYRGEGAAPDPVDLSVLLGGAAADGVDDAGAVGEAHEAHGHEWEATANDEDEWLGFSPSAWPPEEVYVAEVEADGWAEYSAELDVDDQILKVNGRDVAAMTKKDMKDAMKKRPLTITFFRLAAGGEIAPPAGAGDWGEVDEAEEAEEDQKKKKKKDKKEKKGKRDSDTYFENFMELAGMDEDSDAEEGEKKGKMKKCTIKAGDEVDNLGWAPSAWPPEDVYIAELESFAYAETKGLKVGDKLTSVNGVLVADLTKSDLKKAMKERPVNMTFERERKKKKKKDKKSKKDED